MTGTAEIIRADSRHLPIADDSVDLIVTSPPYFALRSYQDGGEHYAGQIGDEPTPVEFVESLLEVTRECVRVLKPSGSLWINLGDKYSDRAGPAFAGSSDGQTGRYGKGPRKNTTSVAPRKSLLGLPWRYALRCIDELGLTLREEIIWSKPNGMPESVTDRVRRSHEQWFHFTLRPRYFSAVDEIREPHTMKPQRRTAAWVDEVPRPAGARTMQGLKEQRDEVGVDGHPLGKLPGSVWTIATEPLRVPAELGIDHFAAFPTEWPKRIIRGWSPTGICTACGEGRRPVVEKKPMLWRPGPAAGKYDAPGATRVNVSGTMLAPAETTIVGEACACPEPTADTTPAVVLDPFGGTGTTALVAKALGRRGISVDMSADYCRLAEWRTNDPAQLAKVLDQPKPKPVDDDQMTWDMFGGESS